MARFSGTRWSSSPAPKSVHSASRRHEALDHDLGVGGHLEALAVGDARHEAHRLARDAARGAPVALGMGELRLRAEHYLRMMADPERERTALAARFPFRHVARVVR